MVNRYRRVARTVLEAGIPSPAPLYWGDPGACRRKSGGSPKKGRHRQHATHRILRHYGPVGQSAELRTFNRVQSAPSDGEGMAWLQLDIDSRGNTPVAYDPSARAEVSCARYFYTSGGVQMGRKHPLGEAPQSTARLFQMLELNALAVPGSSTMDPHLPASVLVREDILRKIAGVIR
jgi:hypothetical protein